MTNLTKSILCLVVATTSTNDFFFPTTSAFSFQKLSTKQYSTPLISSTQLFSTQQQQSSFLPLDRAVRREVDQFQAWAGQCGVQAENGFCLAGDMVDENEDYYAVTSTGGARGSRVLFVPGEMILSASMVAGEYQGYIEKSLSIVGGKGYHHLYAQFVLFLKILVEYEQGTNSPYYPWLAALPRAWNTAVSFDGFCMTCLPPYLKSLCEVERTRFKGFKEGLKAFDYLSPESKQNEQLLKFAYNVVFTRSFPTPDGDYRIAPVADMFNHGYPDNVQVSYDQNGNCEVYLKEDVAPGTPLTLSYGEPTNPSRLLSIYGFLNEAPAAYCKILFTHPSQELKDVGYNSNRMLFYTQDGSISQEVWDVLLFSRLEKKKNKQDMKNAFYQAHMNGDQQTKMSIHAEFQEETTKALLRHVNHVLIEVHELTVKMNSFDSSKHPRLPLLLRHHAMVTETFAKVRDNLSAMLSYQ